MKKLIFIIAGIFYLFVSCEKTIREPSQDYDTPSNKKMLALLQSKSSEQEKIVIFNTFSSDEKSDIWKLHLLGCKNNLGLSLQQQDLIQQTIDYISPEKYDHPELYLNSPEFTYLEGRMHALFALNLRMQVFNDLGDRLEGKKGAGTGILLSNCTCSSSSDYCGWRVDGSNASGFKCILGANYCSESGAGCGTLGFYTCNGLCGRKN